MTSETPIDLAIAEFRAGNFPSARSAAHAYDIPQTTFQRRLKGATDRRTARKAQQRLSKHEETILVRSILQLAFWGQPMTHKTVDTLANNILENNGDYTGIGVNWYQSFVLRYTELKLIRSRAIDQSRKNAIDYDIMKEQFNLYHLIKTQYRIPDSDMYNIDKKGIIKSIGENVKVVVSRKETVAFSSQPGNRKQVSIIEYVNAINFVLPPFIIFEGQRIQIE